MARRYAVKAKHKPVVVIAAPTDGAWVSLDSAHYTVSADGQTLTDRGSSTLTMVYAPFAGGRSGNFRISQVGSDQSGGGGYIFGSTDNARATSQAPTPNQLYNTSQTYTLSVSSASTFDIITLSNGSGIPVAEYRLRVAAITDPMSGTGAVVGSYDASGTKKWARVIQGGGGVLTRGASGAAITPSGAGGAVYDYGSLPLMTDFDMSVTITLANAPGPGSNNDQVGMFFRFDGNNSFSNYWVFFAANTNAYILRRASGGSSTDFALTGAPAPADGDVLRVLAVGPRIRAYVNGTKVADVSDGTNYGLYYLCSLIYSANAGTPGIKNLSVAAPPITNPAAAGGWQALSASGSTWITPSANDPTVTTPNGASACTISTIAGKIYATFTGTAWSGVNAVLGVGSTDSSVTPVQSQTVPSNGQVIYDLNALGYTGGANTVWFLYLKDSSSGQVLAQFYFPTGVTSYDGVINSPKAQTATVSVGDYSNVYVTQTGGGSNYTYDARAASIANSGSNHIEVYRLGGTQLVRMQLTATTGGGPYTGLAGPPGFAFLRNASNTIIKTLPFYY